MTHENWRLIWSSTGILLQRPSNLEILHIEDDGHVHNIRLQIWHWILSVCLRNCRKQRWYYHQHNTLSVIAHHSSSYTVAIFPVIQSRSMKSLLEGLSQSKSEKNANHMRSLGIVAATEIARTTKPHINARIPPALDCHLGSRPLWSYRTAKRQNQYSRRSLKFSSLLAASTVCHSTFLVWQAQDRDHWLTPLVPNQNYLTFQAHMILLVELMLCFRFKWLFTRLIKTATGNQSMYTCTLYCYFSKDYIDTASEAEY